MTDTGRETPSEPAPSAKRALDPAKTPGRKADRSKRLRVSRACDQCRAGREKCDGGHPRCDTCVKQTRSCTYNEQPKKRGIQPNYIRTLELTLAWLFKTFPQTEQHLSELLPDPQHQGHRVIAYKDIPASDALHNDWRNGIVWRQIDQLLSGADIELPKPNLDEGVYQSPPLSAPSDTGVLRPDALDAAFSVRAPPAPINQQPLPDGRDSENLKLPADAWSLLEHYFTFTQTWLPITEKHDILRLMYTYPPEGLPRTQVSTSEHAELWSIMALATSQIHSPEQTVDFEVYRKISRLLIPRDESLNFGHVRALLTLSLIDMSNNSWITAWLTIGSAVRILAYLIATYEAQGAITSGRVKHTILAAFLLESVTSSRTGATAHMRPHDVERYGLLVEDGLEEWSPWSDPTPQDADPSAARAPARTISTFNGLVRTALATFEQNSSTATGQRPSLDVIRELLRNASVSNLRDRPATVVLDFQSTQTPVTHANDHTNNQTPGPSGFTGATLGPHEDDLLHQWRSQGTETFYSAIGQQLPFTSIPPEAPKSVAGSSISAQGVSAGPVPDVWTNDANSRATIDIDSRAESIRNAVPTPDIFEELAMLERTDSGQKPSFLQNLGFGPDLDLAEFFGADYMPSTYVQSQSFGESSNAYG